MSERFDTFGAPPPEPDPWDTTTATEPAEDGGTLDLAAAAALLEQTRRQARRTFDRRPPLLLLAGAPAFLLAYGSAWWSTRGQHPYVGPAGWSLGVIYSIVIAWAIAVTLAFKRATSGVGGRAARQRRAEGVAFAAVWISVYVVQGALYHAGASDAIAYGIWPATAPLIFVGGAAATNAAARAEWRTVVLAVALIAVCLGGLFSGPSTVWLVAGAGLAAVVAAFGLNDLRRRRSGAA
jgi:hypothetical protein